MGKKGLSKKVDKLEKKTEDLRKKAEKKAGDLQDIAEDRIGELTGEKEKKRRGKLALVFGVIAAVAVVLKKKRDQELDEALWEEPRSV
jgi:hypothetical protein